MTSVQCLKISACGRRQMVVYFTQMLHTEVPADRQVIEIIGAPYGNRTRVSALRGPRPRPLDEGSVTSRNSLPGMKAQAFSGRHSGAAGTAEPGIHNHQSFRRIGGECSANVSE